ncbi:MAG: hypothetical protein RIS94_1535 [Pseudomonadota bacterium]|jgi:uncharacterized protein (DUF2141 family)
MKRALMLLPLALLGANAPMGTTVSINVSALRDASGFVRMCLTGNAALFPKKCDLDPAARKLSVKASDAGTVVFHDVPPGRYAIALLHDENGNGKMDWSFIGMPKEGFGFSRDAPVKLSAPKFDSAAFDVGGQPVRMTMKVRYLL